MLISEIPIILVLLLISLFSTSQELLGARGQYLKLSFIIVSSGLLCFSLTHNLLCSDYDSYSSIYNQIYTSTPIQELIGIDKSFTALAIIWQLLFNDDFSIFLRIYQTIGLGLIIFAISRLSWVWSNTVLFLIIFGSLQFYHLSLCASRQGLSSGFVAIIFSLAIERSNSKINFVKSFKFMFIGLFLVSIYCHWTGIFMGVIFYGTVVFSQNLFSFQPDPKKVSTKPSRLFFRVLILLTLIGVILYFGSTSIEFEKINLYLSEVGGGYGTNISYTFLADILFIFMSFYYIKTTYRQLDLSQTEANDFSQYSVNSFSIVALILISILSLFFKLLAFLGYGTAIRIIIELTMVQYLLLPILLDKTKILARSLVILFLSSPYLYFIFFISEQEFQ
jgi:hypothetical protein